jgi:hypothetical protein
MASDGEGEENEELMSGEGSDTRTKVCVLRS